MTTYEHIGFPDIWLTDPRITVEVTIEGVTHFFGCHTCTERELCDFVRMRAAQLMLCGQFDSRMNHVSVTVQCEDEIWSLAYNEPDHKFELC